ncbi:MAG: TolC family protein [Crinalium sp.]
MNYSFWQVQFLVIVLVLLFPSLAECQYVSNNSSSNLRLLDSNSKELPLTITEAVYFALENNRELKIAYLQRILDKKQLAETESQFNPTFTPQISVSSSNAQDGSSLSNNRNASLGASINWKMPTGGNISLTLQGQNQLSENNSLSNRSDANSLNQSINFTQPLLRGFGTQINTLNIKKTRLAEKANLLNFVSTKSQIITNTILSYRNLLLAQERLKIEQISVGNSKKDLERLQALFEFGRISKNDLVERQADIAQQEVNLVNTQSALEQAITDLNKVLDLPVPKKLIAIETPAPPASFNLPSYAEMLDLTLANNTAYLNALNSVENANFGVIEARNQQQWDLNFNLSSGLNSATNSQDTSNLNSSFTLSREFGNPSKDNSVDKSQISLQSSQLALENNRKNLEEELKTKIRNIEDTFRQIKLAQQARQLAETKVTNAKERMRLSSNISMTDIINFEKSLVDAKNQELNAVINHLNSVTQMEQFLGITLSKWLK